MVGFREGWRAVVLAAVLASGSALHAQDFSSLEASVGQSAAAALQSARDGALAGDLTGAAATLERALIADPQANSVRMAYIALLCRLDDAQGARLELAKLDGQPGDDIGFAKVQEACGAVPRPKGPVAASGNGITGEIGAGIAYDSDSLNALATPLAAAAPTGDGLGFVGSFRADGRTAVGGGFVYGGVRGVTRNSLSGPRQNYQMVDGRLGFGGQSGGTDFSLGGAVRYGRIADQSFVTEVGPQAEIGFASGGSSRIALRGEAVRQNYRGDTVGNIRTGWRYDLGLSWTLRLKDDGIMVLGGAVELKDAGTRQLGYTGGRLFFGIHLPISRGGAYFDGSSTLRYWDYRNVAGVTDRREWRGFNRAAIGVPVGAPGLAIEAAVSHSARDYNGATLLKDYSSFGGELRLVYRLGQGGEGR